MARNEAALYEYDGLCTRLRDARRAIADAQAWLLQAAGEFEALKKHGDLLRATFEEARDGRRTMGGRSFISLRDWERVADIADAAEDTWTMHRNKTTQADCIIKGKERYLETMIALAADLELSLENFCTVLEFRRNP